MWYIKDGRVKFAVYYSLVLGALIVLWSTAPGAFLRGGFVVSSVLLGIGLGVDVIGATIGRFQILNNWSARLMWAYRTAASHTIVALTGLFICIALAAWAPGFATAIRIGGLAAIIVMLVREGFEQRAAHEDPAVSGHETAAPRDSVALRLADWGLVLAVSMDAAICMPTQSALIAEWSYAQIVFAMLLVGAVVGMCAISGGVALTILGRSGNHSAWLPQLERWGYFTEVLVITFIGWRGVIPLWASDGSVTLLSGVCAVVTSVAFSLLFAPRAPHSSSGIAAP